MSTASETELLSQAKAGDRAAFEEALTPYLPMLFAYSRAICGDYHAAQDVVQETALIAYRNLNHLFPEADFAIWLRAIARRQALTARRQLTRVSLVGDELIEQVYADPGPLTEGPRQVALADCLERLSGRMAHAIRARYFQGADLAEVARTLDMNVSAVKQLLYRARLWLQTCMGKRLAEEDAQ
jgi:RNA polymerase sigma-70 factor, ECF subfamily